MAQLWTVPGQHLVTSAGVPYSGAKCYFYRSGTTTAQTVFQDSDLTTPHAQPVVADASGRFDPIYLDSNADFDYRVRILTSADALIEDYDDVPRSVLSDDQVGEALYPQTTAESSAGVTPSDYDYPPGDIRRYGAVSDGSTDCTTAITNAVAQAAQGGAAVFIPSAASYFKVTAAIALSDDVTVYGNGWDAYVKQDTADLSLFTATDKTRVAVRNLRMGGATSTASIAGVMLLGCTDSVVDGCLFTGFSWACVDLRSGSGAATRCHVRNNTMRDWSTPVNGSAGVNLYSSTLACTITGNTIEGGSTSASTGADFGISIFESSGSGTAHDITVTGNVIRNMREYGIVVYSNGGLHEGHNISGNLIDTIYGASDNTGSGMGIYLASVGKTEIVGNEIRNTNISTAATNLTPAAIGINAHYSEILIANNVIDHPRFYGIDVASATSTGRCTIIGNTIHKPVKYGIFINAAGNTQIVGNRIRLIGGTSTDKALYVLGAVGTHIENVVVSGNHIECVAAGDIVIQYVDRCTVSGNIWRNTVTTGVAYQFANNIHMSIHGNHMESASTDGVALSITDCTYVRGETNQWICSHTSGISTSGTCTNGFLGRSNIFTGVPTNAATGLILEYVGTGAPASGTHAVGDTVWFSNVASGGPAATSCTTAGTPGTFKAWANIA